MMQGQGHGTAVHTSRQVIVVDWIKERICSTTHQQTGGCDPCTDMRFATVVVCGYVGDAPLLGRQLLLELCRWRQVPHLPLMGCLLRLAVVVAATAAGEGQCRACKRGEAVRQKK